MTPPSKEGLIPFKVPAANKECNTWYKIVGDLSSGKTPLITLHGGPGACHEYLLPFIDLTTQYSIPVIFYDQLGNGASTHLREKDGDTSFWTEQLFRDELDNLIDGLGLRDTGFDILGQSWGGMLGSAYASYRPRGLRRLVIANSPADMGLWVEACGVLREALPKDVQETLTRCERDGLTESPEYEEAVTVFYKRHVCRLEPWPVPEIAVTLQHLKDDPTVYGTMNGPSEFYVVGNLKTWSVIDRLPNIEVPTLVYNGREDEAQDSCVVPYFQHIPKVKWVVVENASHFAHVEQRPQVMKLVGEFLTW